MMELLDALRNAGHNKWLATSGGSDPCCWPSVGKPVYVIATDHAGSVVGSLRILPGAGPALLKSGFGQQFVPPPALGTGNVWECSRFCVHPEDGTERRISSYLLEGLCEHGIATGIGSIVGFFDRPMRRIFYRLGWSPETIAESEL